MTSPDVNIIFAEEPININLGEEPVEIEMPAGLDGQSLHPRGAWSSSEEYGYLDLVSYQGSSYVATKTVPVGTLPTDTGFWMLSAEKGLDGASEWGNITGDIANQTDLAQALAGKANVGDSYTKAETDTLLADKADANDVYTKAEVDDALADKADSDDVYTKTETDTLLLDKAPVILNSASGSIASFSDGSSLPVTALTVDIEPVQDLHGYDTPWPAGGGKNLWGFGDQNPTTFSSCKFDNPLPAGTYTISALVTTTYTGNYCDIRFRREDESNILRVQIGANSGSRTSVTVTLEEPAYYAYVYASTTTTTYSASWKDIQLESGSTATSYAPYSNICPISGHTSATVTRTDGQNILDYTDATKSYDSASLVITPNSDGISIRYSASSSGVSPYRGADFYKTEGLTSILESGKSYTLSWHVSGIADGQTFNFGLRNQSNNSYKTGFNKALTKDGDYFITFTYTDAVGCYLSVVSMAAFNYNITLSNLILAESDFVTIDLGEERYGGTLDVTTGMLTVTKAIVDLGTLNWGTYNSTYKVWDSSNISSLVESPSVAGDLAEIVSDTYKNVTWNNLFDNRSTPNYTGITIGSVSSITNKGKIRVRTGSDVITPTGQLVYKLKSPVTVQLSPSQMQTLLGQNHVFADTGDVAVTYRADTKLFIQEQIAESQRATRSLIAGIEAEMVATKNYSTGDLLIVGDSLYKTTANIGNGSAITVGTNVTATTVAEQLIALANA